MPLKISIVMVSITESIIGTDVFSTASHSLLPLRSDGIYCILGHFNRAFGKLFLGKRRRGWQRMRWLDCIPNSNGHEFEQALGVGNGQGSQVCCSPWGHRESDMP